MANKGSYLTAAGKYKSVGMHSAVLGASPHRLVQLLFDGAVARVAEARGHVQRGNVAGRASSINACINIISGLRGALDLDQGGEIAVHLDQLYDYMARRLLAANRKNDLAALDEVHGLINELRSGWSAIRAEVEDAPAVSRSLKA